MISLFGRHVEQNSQPANRMKAEKLNYVLGEDAPTVEQLQYSLDNGGEAGYNQQLAFEEEQQVNRTRLEVLNEAFRHGATVEDVQMMDPVVTPVSINPDFIIEKKYAEKISDQILTSDEDIADELDGENPVDVWEVADQVTDISVRNAFVTDAADKLQHQLDEDGLLTKAVGFGTMMIPFLSWYVKTNAVENAPTESVFVGSNLSEQITYLYNLPQSQFKQAFKQAFDDIAAISPYDALYFAEAVRRYSKSDAFMANVLESGVDIASLVPVGAAGRAVKALRKVPDAASLPPSKASKIASKVGLNEQSAVVDVVENTLETGQLLGDIRNAEKLEVLLPRLFSPGKVFEGATESTTANARLKAALQANADTLRDFVAHNSLVDRLTPEQLAERASAAFDEVKTYFNRTEDYIIDSYEVIEAGENVGNVSSIAVRFGDKSGDYFKSEKGAKNWAERTLGKKTSDYEVKQEGTGFYVEVRRNIDEGGILIPSEELPDSGWISGALRSPDYILNQSNIQARSVASQTQVILNQMLEQTYASFKQLSKREYEDLNVLWKNNVSEIDPVTKQRGRFYRNMGEFDEAFYNAHNRQPTDAVREAYFTYTQLYDLDYLIRDLDLYKQKASRGFERITLNVGDEVLEFDGKVLTELPWDDASNSWKLRIIDGEDVKKISPRFAGKKDREYVDKLIGKGFNIVRDDANATYYVTNKYKRGRIGVGNVNYRPGGHKQQAHPFYVKQPIITESGGVTRYSGDLTLYGARSMSEAKEIAGHFDKARQLLVDNPKQFKAYVQDNLAGITTPRDLAKKFKGKSKMSLRSPIVGVREGQRSKNIVDSSKWVDNTTVNRHNELAEVRGRYTGKKDEVDIDVLGSENDAVFKTNGDTLMDPMRVLRNSMANIVDLRTMEDYALKSSNDYIGYFRQLLKGTDDDFRFRPLSYLYNPQYKDGVDAGQMAQAEAVRRSVVRLLDNSNPIARSLDPLTDRLAQNLLDAKVYKDFNTAKEHLSTMTNVDRFLRKGAFNLKLGLFNFRQLTLQTSAVLQAWAISPVSAMKAGRMTVFFPFVRMAKDDDMIMQMAKWAEKRGSGWKAEDAFEAIIEFRKSGFWEVGGDVAYLDDFATPKMRNVIPGTDKVDHAYFFNQGERNARWVAWMTAYDEWKSGKLVGRYGLQKGGKMDRRVREGLLQRAKDLTGNMTRESNAAWQKGWLSPVTQFMGYQMRMTEQMLSPRKLTSSERLRLITTMGGLYGVGVPAGAVALGIVPGTDVLRQTLMGAGIEYDDTMGEFLVDGMISEMWEYVFDAELDFSSSFGPGGLPTFYDLLREDSTWTDLVLGASGGIALDIWKDSQPLLYSLWAMTNPEAPDFPIMPKDVIDILRNASSVNNAYKVQNALTVQKILSQNETYIADISVGEAMSSFFSGAPLEKEGRGFTALSILKGRRDSEKALMKDATKAYKRAWTALQNDDIESFRRWTSRAKIYMDTLDGRDRARVMRNVHDNVPFDEKMEKRLMRELYGDK